MKKPWGMSYMVLCREDTKPDGSKGDYVLATRRTFYNKGFEDDYGDPARRRAFDYAKTIHPSREPIVVQVLPANVCPKLPQKLPITKEDLTPTDASTHGGTAWRKEDLKVSRPYTSKAGWKQDEEDAPEPADDDGLFGKPLT